MRSASVVVYCLGLLTLPAAIAGAELPADPAVQKGEVIVIEGAPPPPKVKAKPKKRWLPPEGVNLDDIFLRIAPPYSDKAILEDAWSVAWMLLDIDERGKVSRVKFLKYPGYDLEKIAVDTALKLEFEPAIGLDGKPLRSYIAWPIEWPSYWWLVNKTGLASGIPNTSRVPCRGSGPLNLSAHHPTYRDCTPPNWAMANTEPWLELRPNHHPSK